jgi:hypothetical protein
MQNSKLIVIKLNASFPASYQEIVQVPQDMTEDEKAELVLKRWREVGGDEYAIDESGFSAESSRVLNCEQGLAPELVVSRGDDGALVVTEVLAEEGASKEDSVTQPAGIYVHFDEDRHAIIAALRFWQRSGMCEPCNRDDEMHDLCTNGDEVTSLSEEGIDQLVMSLNMGPTPEAFIADLKRLTKQ